MTTTLTSALKRGKSFFASTPQEHEGGFTKAPSATTLFPQVDPTIDGEDCLHDCESCTVKYPNKFKVDEEEKLYGHVNGWATHMLVATGKTDWVRDVSDEKGSVMEAVRDCGVEPTNGPREHELPFFTHPSPHTHLLLLCSQRTRDARCGISAPLLAREFGRHLRARGLYRDIHDERPGGDCENIIRFTVLQGKIVKPNRQLRGGFDRKNQIVSW
ncbi:MAG: hypothetical protein LQ350_000646 [Teloschistes chrysophthalmus]|nr:MAG: hypothetical protein LQ350_000646 [Niorma chrysophthalma]